MKFVIKHPTRNSFLRKPRFVGDTVHWTEANGTPRSTREPWVFATRSGADKARDMHALGASVEPCPRNYGVMDTPVCNTGMQDYTLAVVLAELVIVSGDFGGC